VEGAPRDELDLEFGKLNHRLQLQNNTFDASKTPICLLHEPTFLTIALCTSIQRVWLTSSYLSRPAPIAFRSSMPCASPYRASFSSITYRTGSFV